MKASTKRTLIVAIIGLIVLAMGLVFFVEQQEAAVYDGAADFEKGAR